MVYKIYYLTNLTKLIDFFKAGFENESPRNLSLFEKDEILSPDPNDYTGLWQFDDDINLDEIFHAHQNLYDSWGLLFKGHSQRSMMVGDLVLDQLGFLYQVKPMGWKTYFPNQHSFPPIGGEEMDVS